MICSVIILVVTNFFIVKNENFKYAEASPSQVQPSQDQASTTATESVIDPIEQKIQVAKPLKSS